ncbi:MAG: isochorismatase family cysteine hydrolase [Candidatus Nezhaarchaeales archaeon]
MGWRRGMLIALRLNRIPPFGTWSTVKLKELTLLGLEASSLKSLIVVDMVNDDIREGSPLYVGPEGLRIVPRIRRLLEEARRRRLPVIYVCDSRSPEDLEYFAKAWGLPPHAVQGSRGAEVIEELKPVEGDLVVPKPRLSGFYRTGLDQLLKGLNVDTVIITGVSTEVCVFKTAIDAKELGYEVIVVSDCCASRSMGLHELALKHLKRFKVKVEESSELLKRL